MLLKIGELASRTGLTVRTLHHYDKIALLTPSARTDAGYRLYNRADIAQLHRVQALRRLDLSLAEIAELLKGNGADLQQVIEQQVISLDRQLTQTTQLRDRLKTLSEMLRIEDEPSLDYWLSTLEMMSMFGKYFSEDDIAVLRQRKESNQGEASVIMRPLVVAVRALMDGGIAPDNPQALELARQWMKTMNIVMAEDPRLFVKLEEMTRNELSVQALTGVDGEMIDYITRANAEIRYQIYLKYVSHDDLRYFRSSFFNNSRLWIALFSELRQKMDQGVAAEHAVILPLMLRWKTLYTDAWPNYPAIMRQLRNAHENEAGLASGPGMTPALLAYARQGLAHLELTAPMEKSQ